MLWSAGSASRVSGRGTASIVLDLLAWLPLAIACQCGLAGLRPLVAHISRGNHPVGSSCFAMRHTSCTTVSEAFSTAVCPCLLCVRLPVPPTGGK